MYIRNENTDNKVYVSYQKRYNAMCILRGFNRLTPIYTKDEFIQKYNEYFNERGTVTNAIATIVNKQIIR